SQVLQIPLSELVATFSSTVILNAEVEANPEYLALQKEYARSQLQLAQQRQTLWQEFQQSSLQVLESLLINLPTVVHKTQEKPDLPAVTVLRLLQTPIAQLLQQWGVEAIAAVGAELPYNPQVHQLIGGTATVGDTVKVRYTGYRQGDKLLYRAKVSPINQG
ncbi:MAG: nucleotide exchange factor GrpE, partial [Nostocaceae cyanobacterium]|nr:nucleotide exchange factor GrpE [Nostocaceae cyanobacterium]